MAPVVGSRRSVRGKASPRGFGISARSIRKPQPFGSRKPVYADRMQVDVLEKGLKALNEGGSEGPEADSGSNRTEITSRKAPMKVAVRVRPLNARESVGNAREIITVCGDNMLTFDPERQQEEFFYRNQKQKDVTARKYKNLKFAFDHVYDSSGTNNNIYLDIMKPLLNTLMSGFNCSVFAYGATGSGKTYTMLGSSENPGLTFLTINDLYERLDAMQEEFETQVVISYFEVYNEQVRDLLNPTGKQLIIMEVGNGIEIKDLSFHHPTDINHLLDMLRHGNANRSQHPTDHNAESSRSHAVLQVHIRMRERHKNMNSSSRTSKLVMVDLAGSEKGCATGFTGQRFREGSSINKSLLALGKVMEALASGKKTFSFRDSKLTRILKDSLGGNCRTVMIANVSPAENLYEDTLNTLRYAQKAKKISCNASKNIITVQSCLTEYTRVVNEMTTKIQTLEKQLKDKDEEARQQIVEKDDRIRELEEKLVAAMQPSKEVENMKAVQIKLMEAEAKLEQMEKNYRNSENQVTELRLKIKDSESNFQIPQAQLPSISHQNTAVNTGNRSNIENTHVAINCTEEDCGCEFPETLFSTTHAIPTFELYFKKAGHFNETFPPKIEKYLVDINLKLQQVSKLHKLSLETGDQRYQKAEKRANGKLESSIKALNASIREAKKYCQDMHLTMVAFMNPVCTEYRISINELWDFLLHKSLYRIESAVSKSLRHQVGNLESLLVRKEDLLTGFALLCNKMHNSLNHYGNLAPALKQEYDRLVSSYSCPSLKFEDASNLVQDEGCMFFQPKEGVSSNAPIFPSNFYDHRKKEIINYVKTVSTRLENISRNTEPQLQHKIGSTITKVNDLVTWEWWDGDMESTFASDLQSHDDDCENLERIAKSLSPEISKGNALLDIMSEYCDYDDEFSSLPLNADVNPNETIVLAKSSSNSTFTLGNEEELQEVDEEVENLKSHVQKSEDIPDLYEIKTVPDAVAEFAGRVGAKFSKTSPMYGSIKTTGATLRQMNYISPGSSSSVLNPKTLPVGRIPVLSPLSISPHKTFPLGPGANNAVSGADKPPTSNIVSKSKSPSPKSPYNSSSLAIKKAKAVVRARATPAGSRSDQKKLTASGSKYRPYPNQWQPGGSKGTWQRPTSRSNYFGNTGDR